MNKWKKNISPFHIESQRARPYFSETQMKVHPWFNSRMRLSDKWCIWKKSKTIEIRGTINYPWKSLRNFRLFERFQWAGTNGYWISNGELLVTLFGPSSHPYKFPCASVLGSRKRWQIRKFTVMKPFLLTSVWLLDCIFFPYPWLARFHIDIFISLIIHDPIYHVPFTPTSIIHGVHKKSPFRVENKRCRLIFTSFNIYEKLNTLLRICERKFIEFHGNDE